METNNIEAPEQYSDLDSAIKRLLIQVNSTLSYIGREHPRYYNLKEAAINLEEVIYGQKQLE